ncbi:MULTISPECIES: hypothetical protein [unclassified Microcoleus]|uniref:hypothetical protein n=1 Tax=unclassified Microcoleus TaxID=2642155 RepID=UPI002FCEDC6A
MTQIPILINSRRSSLISFFVIQVWLITRNQGCFFRCDRAWGMRVRSMKAYASPNDRTARIKAYASPHARSVKRFICE